MLKFHNFLSNRIEGSKPIILIIISTLILILIELFFYYLFLILNIPHTSNLSKIEILANFDSIAKIMFRLLKVSIMAPIIETLIFQYLLFELFYVKLNFNSITFCLVGAIIFGLFHYYSIPTIIITFTIGLVLNYLYLILRNKTNKKKAYIIVSSTHSLLNIVVFIDQYLNSLAV